MHWVILAPSLQVLSCCCCRFARNKQQPWFALGAEGAGKVAAVGPGVEGLAVGQAVTFVGGAFSGETQKQVRQG